MNKVLWRLLYLAWVQIGPEAPEGVYLARQYKRRSWARRDPKISAAYKQYRNHPLVRGFLPWQWDLSAY